MAYILSEPRANDVLDRLNRIFADVQTRSNTLLAKATSNINDAIAFAEYIDRQDQAISAAIASIDNQALINVARAEYNDPAYDPVAEFTAARTAMNNLASFIDTNIPREPSGAIGAITWTLDVGRVPVQLTAAQRSALNAQITTFLTNFV